MTSSFFLKPNVVIEPLFKRWYAWSHLISPATAAMNILGRHIEIMNSYIESPEDHAAALKNPKMRGGPFMDYERLRISEIEQLLDTTLKEQEEQIQMALAIKKLDKLLRENAKGFSLESLYEKVPDILKGYVELVYDLNNNASFRFFEHLLYKSNFYNPNVQSIALWLTDNDSRPFSLSTPRLNESNVLHLDMQFDNKLIDELSKMKRTPGSYSEIKQMLNIHDKDENLFRSFFTEEAPPPYKKYEGDKIRMRYFGHACILVETKDVSILIDPLISYYGYNSPINHFSEYDLPDVIDYVLITHNHQDHILFETLLPLRHRIKQIVVPSTRSGALQDPNLKLMFNAIGFDNILEIDEMESICFNDCTITGIPFTGEHSDLNIHSKICHLVNIGEFTLLFVADSRVLEPRLYNNIKGIIGNVDVIFLGMECDGAPLTWLYGPLLTQEITRENDSSRRLAGSECSQGMSLVKIFNPSEVYVYAMGQEPWCEFISSIKYTEASNPIVQSNKLIEQCKNYGIIAERLYGEKEILYSKKKNNKMLEKNTLLN